MPPRSTGRAWRGYAAAVLGVAATTAVSLPLRAVLADTTVALVLLLLVLVVASVWGSAPALAAAGLAVVAFNFFFLSPHHAFAVGAPQSLVALGAFLVTAIAVGQLAARARRNAAEARAGWQEAKRQSAYNRSLIEASLDPMAAIDRDGRITDVNAATEGLTGASRAELIGTDFPDCFTEPEKARAAYERTFREGTVRDYTLKVRHRAGHVVPVLYNATVYRDEAGAVVGVFAVARTTGPLPHTAGAAIAGSRRSGPEPVEGAGAPPAGPARPWAIAPALAAVPAPVVQAMLAALPSLACLGLQWAFWPAIRPHAWFGFYPAVFISSWIGGLSAGLLSTAVSAAVVWWTFLPPEHGFVKGEPAHFLTTAVAVGMGTLFSFLHARLRTATQQAQAALAAGWEANRTLREARDEIARLVEEASEGIFLSDLEGRCTDVNRAGCRLLRARREDLVGRSIFDLVPPADVPRAREIFDDLLAGGIHVTEWNVIRSDGTTLPVEVSGKILPDGRWQGFVRDINERRRAEEALREREAQLKRAQEIAHVGSWHLDVRRDRLTWSDEVFHIFDLPVGTPLGYEAFLERVHPEDRRAVEAAWAAALRGAAYDVEHRIVCGDRVKWVRERAEVEFDADRNPLAGIGTVQDVTERKRAQDELLRINRAHRALSSCNEALIRAEDEAAWLQEVCRIVVEEAGYLLCWVGRAEHDAAKTVRPLAQAGRDDGYLARLHVTWEDAEHGRGPTGTAIRTGQPHVVKDIAADPSFAPWRADALARGYRSAIAIPLVVEGARFGALTIYAAETEAFGPEEMRLLTELSADLGYGVTSLRTRAERARAEEALRVLNTELEARVAARTAQLKEANAQKDALIERERATAAALAEAREREAALGFRIQEMLLLKEPPRGVAGLQLAALTIPSQHIDGDFYDFFVHDDRRIDLVVADVMGKGIPAALLAAATKTHFLEALYHLMATAKTEGLPAPRDVVSRVHAQLAEHLVELESFVTLGYARVDLARRTLELVDCGHTGAMLVRAASGRCEAVHGENLPLGIRRDEVFEEVAVPFEPGDVFLFYSDGVTDMRSPSGERFGVRRLAECLEANRALEPEALVEAIRAAAVEFGGSELLADDLTCVVGRVGDRRPPLARGGIEIASDLRELARAREFVRAFCRDLPGAALDEAGVAALVLAVNEAASNIMKHAYRGRIDRRIELELEAFPGHVAIRLCHVGDPFDPSAVSPPALDGSSESGFGVFLIRKSVDGVRYSRDEHGKSCIALVKRTSPCT